ncbi:hypothetical protein DL764_008547 [Monosporascus ibericus]|uniref:Zn(2)-C6 fungal-type domain-containing protein n=1 Tax=Monosporascus ibericus TaxID=155417 RepID=A0A4Q4T079_9PEZI|nr:hypothetical protein DL764_008547 [Monosporascus ibericus]
MEALLDSQQQRGNHVCGSVDDLQAQLHNFLLSKSSDTRAEHVSLTFELRYNAIFYLTAEPENGSADNADPAQPRSQPPPSQQVTRTLTASETIQSQPSDDPVLQKAVAKHVIGRINTVDNSSWIVRQVARGAQGWTFTYICKDSHQAWTRANAKNPERPVIGSFSGNGGLDPINLSRPAFDCRGTLSIAFSKSRRAVIVQYDHTLLHKTVGQLVELLAPAPVPAPVNGMSTRTPKAKRPPPAEGEEGSRKKRAGKKGKAPEAPMAVEDASATDSQQAVQSGPENGATPQSSTVQAPGFLNVPPAEAARRRETAVSLLTNKGIDPATLSAEQFNIFANQAPQLQEASLEMLAKYGAEKLRIVHPDDKDQAGSASSTPAQAQSATPTPAVGSAGAASAVDTPTKKKRSSKKKSDAAAAEVSIGDGAVISVEQNGEVGTTSSALEPPVKPQAKAKRTRGACIICKQKKLKCTKEHPACSVCQQSGEQCVYAAPKPRRKSEKSAEVVAEQEDSDVPDEAQQREQFQYETQASMPAQSPAPQPETQLAPQLAPQPAPQPTSQSVPPAAPATSHVPTDPENEEFIPDPNILSAPIEHHSAPPMQPSDGYYPGQEGLPYPSQVANTDRDSMPGLTFPHQTHGATSHPPSGLTFPPAQNPAQQQSTYSQIDTSSPISQEKERPPTAGRRSLPTAQMEQTPVLPPTIPMQTNHWSGGSATPAQAPADTVSPTMTQQTAKRQRSRRSVAEAPQQMQDSMQQAVALSQAAVQAQNERSPVTTMRSPYQDAATATRTKSRQDHRSQTNTPVSQASLPQPPVQQPVAHQGTTASYTANTTANSIPNYDPYARYNTTSTSNNQYSGTSNDHSSSRTTYEPSSYHTSSPVTTSASYSSAPSYDYTRSTTSTSNNPLSQALNPTNGYSSTSSSASTHWPAPQARSSQTQSTNPYPPTHGYSNPTEQRTSTTGSYSQAHPQTYSYSSQQPAANQQSQQNWYGFTPANSNANQSSYSSNRSTGYGGGTTSSNPAPYQSQRSNVSGYSGHGYGGSDEQSIYDLLRTSGSGN